MDKHQLKTRPKAKRVDGFLHVIAAAVCIVLGIIGLVIPVIPGVIFIAIAAIFLARVSNRMDRWVKSSPFMRNTQSRMDSMNRLGWTDKFRVTLWYAGYGLARVGEFLARQINRARNRRT